MALLQCRFYSESLGLMTSAVVVLPEKREEGALLQTLYLLHGLSDDDSIWLRRTSIERYADPLGLAVVMPQVHRSFYTDMESGYPYWTFLSEELPQIMRAMFPLSAARGDNFAAGLSMGGYGAFKLALNRPERFAAAASLSGALNMAATKSDFARDMLDKDIRLIYGSENKIAGTNNDLLWLLEQHRGTPKEQLPALYQWCGTEDFLYEDNLAFRDKCKEAGIPLVYEEGPGSHEWRYWDEKIQDVLNWLPLRKK